MELLQLRYFCTVAQMENMTRAAQLHTIPQPAMSKTISRLEQELGCPLFDRLGKRLRINRAGQAFYQYASAALSQLENGVQAVKELSCLPSGEIRLLVLESSKILPEILSTFRAANPEVQFSLSQHLYSSHGASHISSFPDFDLCISSLPLPFTDASYVPLLDEPILLAVPKEHPLAQRKSVSLGELREESFVGLRPFKSLRQKTDALCSLYGFSPKMVFESDDAATVRGLIGAGLGVAFLPKITWDAAKEPSICLLRIEHPDCRRTLAISWSNQRYLSNTAQRFRDFVASYYKRRFPSAASPAQIASASNEYFKDI